MEYKINSNDEYRQVMDMVEVYLQKATQGGGFKSLSEKEQGELNRLSLLAEAWEDNIPLMPIRQPETLIEMMQLKMYEHKLKQKDLAKLLEITPARLSSIMQGKTKINLELAQKIYFKLNVNPEFILKKANSHLEKRPLPTDVRRADKIAVKKVGKSSNANS